MTKLGYHVKDVIIMDNSPVSFSFQPENGILCPAYYDDKNDRYLKDVIPYMEQLAKVKDVRSMLKK